MSRTLGLSGDEVIVAPYTTGGCNTSIPPVVLATQSHVTISDVAVLRTSDIIAAHTHFSSDCDIVSHHAQTSFEEDQIHVRISGVPVAINANRSRCSSSHILDATGPPHVTITL